MSVVISEGQSANVVESDELIASDAVFDLVDPPRRRRSSPWHRFMASVAIWTLYVPHHSVLWLLGPRWGFIWVRIAATIHWSLTFVGAQRPTRRALEQVYPQLGTNLSISQLLRRHLQMKHECFAWVRVYGLHGAKSDTSVRWRVAPECSSTKADIEAHEHGLIFVGYHFGYYQLCAAALSQMIPGCNPVQLRHRIARCAEHAMSPVARLVMYQAIKADRRSGAPIFYFDRETSLRRLYRLLRGGGTLTIAADGMSADDFVDVPFLDGTLRVPIGWARLAAATSSEVPARPMRCWSTNQWSLPRTSWPRQFALSKWPFAKNLGPGTLGNVCVGKLPTMASLAISCINSVPIRPVLPLKSVQPKSTCVGRSQD